MNTETKAPVQAGYSDEQVAKVMEAQKLNRIGAIHLIKRMGVAKALTYVKDAPVAKAAKPKAAKKVKREAVNLPKKSSDKVKVDMAKLDDVIRRALKEAYGHVCPILGVLGYRFAVPSQSQGYPFYRVLAEVGGPGKSDLQAVYVGGLHANDWKVSMTPAVKSSYTVANLLKRIANREKRAAAKVAKAEKAVKKVAAEAKRLVKK